MKSLPRVALSFSLTGLLLLVLAATLTLAAPPTTPDIDGTIANDDIDWDNDELIVDDPLNDSPWSSSNELDNLYVTWDQNNLYVGISYTIDNNAMIVYVETGADGGETDFNSGNGYTGAYPRNFTFSTTHAIDLMLARWFHTAPQVYTIVDNAATEVSGSAVFSYTNTNVEYGVPWSLIGRPLGGEFCLVNVIAGGDNWNGPDAMPDNPGMSGDGSATQLVNFYCAPNGSVIINELDADQVGTDAAEFIELYDGGMGNTPLDGLVLVLYNGSSDTSYQAFDLDGQTTNANGYFVLCGDAANVPNCDLDVTPNTDLIQNGQDAAALYADDAATFPTGTAVTTTNLIDALVYDTNDADDPGLLTLLNPGQPQINEASVNSIVDSNQRCPNGSGGYRNTDTYIQAEPTAGTANNCPGPDVTVTKSGPSVAQPGSIISYTLLYENIGALDAFDVVLTDTLPAGYVSYVADDSGLTCPACVPGATGTLAWTVGPLSSTDTFSFTLVAAITDTVPFGESLTNTVTIATSSSDNDPSNNSDQWVTNISTLDLSVSKDGPAVGLSQEPLVYLMTVSNQGVGTAVNTILTDTLPLNATYVADDSGYTCPACVPGASGVLTWTIGDVPSNTISSFNLTVTVDITPAATMVVTNTASISTDTSGDDPGNNSDSLTSTIWNIVPIATARAGANGDVFALEGQVTAANNTWNNAPEWVFQDASGGIAAFFLTNPAISLGDTVRMVATRGSFNNQEQMVTPLYHFEIVSAGPPVAPISYTTGEVASGISEGWLIQMEGTVSGMPATCGSAYNISLDDGTGATTVRIESATGINLCNLGLENGDMLGVTGFSTQFQTTYQVKPRSLSDLQLFVDAPIVVSTTPANNATNVLTDTLITIQFNEPVTVTADWFNIECSQSGVVTADSSPTSPSASYTLTPDNPFVNGEICHVTVFADEVSNGGGLNMFSDYLFSFTIGPAPVFGICGDPAVPIHFIQGNEPTTPILGTTVIVEAIVVGDYQDSGQFGGYFLQEEDGEIDGDALTSEGLFVFSTATAVAPGDRIRVRGTATEFNNLTQIGSVTDVAVCASGQSVTPVDMTLPVADMADWEAVEGMLVAFTHDLHVTEHFTLGRYGEVDLSVNGRLYQPTNLVAPGAPAQALQELNDRSHIVLDDALNIQNPDTVIYPDPGLTYTNTLRTGALVHNLTGVVDYRASSYRIQPVGAVDFSNTADRPAAPDPVGGNVKVASFNVLNYFTTLDTGSPICGPSQDMDCRGANSAFEFERQRTKILNAIVAMDADVVGLIEIENHITDTAVIDLVAGLNGLAGAGTYAYIDTGVIGTDAIKQAFIYQPANVTPIGDYAILDSSVISTFIDTRNRPTLIQTFAENGTGERFTVAVNHLKSKGSACDDIGDPDTGDGQGNCNLTRTSAATALVDYLATDPTNSGSDRFLVIGDMNSYAMEDPITVLRDAGYTDLLREFYGDGAYSYVFDGQFGHLDHSLVSPGLSPYVNWATVWHINADEPIVLDYNVEFKTSGQIDTWYSPEPFRSSDHDPVVVGLLFPTITIITPEDGTVYTSTDGTAVSVPVTITTTDFTIPNDGNWQLMVNGSDYGAISDYATAVDLLPGTHVISASLNGFPNVVDSVTVVVTATETQEEHMLYLPFVVKPASSAAADATNSTAAAPASSQSIAMASLGLLPMLMVFGWGSSRRYIKQD
ncbi:MAG: ExeM/NucH family extracellular endonuclease [Ardenticatenaceae bacterium]|nr:ExeM/NucH family extracellular endonuclease [Ardenticatenaceae bacterium]